MQHKGERNNMNKYKITTIDGVSMLMWGENTLSVAKDARESIPGVKLVRIQLQ